MLPPVAVCRIQRQEATIGYGKVDSNQLTVTRKEGDKRAMLTFCYELIYGESWVAKEGVVDADTIAKARAAIFEELEVDDPYPDRYFESTEAGITRFKVYLTEATEGISAERVEFWQVPTLFDPVTEIPIVS